MKKLLIIAMAFLIAVTLISCKKETTAPNPDNGTSDKPQTPGTTTPENPDTTPDTDAQDQADLIEILDKVTKDIPLDTMIDTVKIDDEMFSSYFFVDPPKEYEAYCSQAMMSAVAHNISLLRVKEGTDVEALRTEIETNLDPRKWVCVEAEKSKVVAKDNLILVVMSFSDVTDKAVENFKAL